MSNSRKQMRGVIESNYDLFDPVNIFPELVPVSGVQIAVENESFGNDCRARRPDSTEPRQTGTSAAHEVISELQETPEQVTPELASPVLATPVLTTPESPAPEVMEPEFDVLIEEESSKELPTEAGLYEIFDRLNMRLFNKKIPRINIKYSKRMLIAGSYSLTKKEINIGWKYHLIFKDDIDDTMAHEMIHYFYPNHGRRFKDMANRFGVSLKAKEHPDLRLACRYLYYCPNCEKEYPRRKRLRMASCGSCTTGRKFDARFKLKLFPKK